MNDKLLIETKYIGKFKISMYNDNNIYTIFSLNGNIDDGMTKYKNLKKVKAYNIFKSLVKEAYDSTPILPIHQIDERWKYED